MGQIDVTELLSDPEFVDPMVIIRRTPKINDYGENQLFEQSFPTYGSIQPASGRTLQRLPDALRVVNAMSFFVRSSIVSDGKCKYPDILIFKGERYAVQTVFDWTMWGEGWSEGVCVREVPTA